MSSTDVYDIIVYEQLDSFFTFVCQIDRLFLAAAVIMLFAAPQASNLHYSAEMLNEILVNIKMLSLVSMSEYRPSVFELTSALNDKCVRLALRKTYSSNKIDFQRTRQNYINTYTIKFNWHLETSKPMSTREAQMVINELVFKLKNAATVDTTPGLKRKLAPTTGNCIYYSCDLSLETAVYLRIYIIDMDINNMFITNEQMTSVALSRLYQPT